MSTELSYLTKKLFKKDSFRDLSAVELDELVGKYPYSSLLQFLYAKKLKDKNAFGYPDAAARSALYFNNPHWLNHLINDQDENGFIPVSVERGKAVEKVVYREVAISSLDNFESNITHETIAEELIESPSESESEPQNPVQMHEYETTETLDPGQDHDKQPGVLVNGVKEIVEHKYENVTEHNWKEPELPIEETTVSSNSTETETPIEENIEVAAQVEEVNARELNVEEKIELSQPEIEVKTQIEKPEIETAAEVVSKVDEPLVPIDPLYAIDYFASLGIRLTAEEETKDKLGRSLKSFTEWLKSMKRIHPEKMAESLDSKTEKHIQTEAEHSNEETEVNTEAMAEVLEKQGRREKAIELYEKLSLLNPAKSAYFAAKIKDLKDH